MKYIMIDESFPILFPDHIEHSFFKDKCLGKITSAGYVSFETKGEAYTKGESYSLNLKSKNEDDMYINMLLRTADPYR